MNLRKMKIVLVGIQTQRGHLFLSLPSLKAYAMADAAVRDGCEIVIKEYFYDKDTGPASIVSGVMAEKPDLIGFTCYIWNMDEVQTVGRLLGASPDSPEIVLGGPSAYADPAGVLGNSPWADMVVRGDGEETFLELIKARMGSGGLSAIKGLTFRDGEDVRSTEDRPIPDDMSRFPSPYLTGVIDLDHVGTVFNFIEVSRGCPFSCKYCQRPGQRHKPRYFPIDRVTEEMRYILRKRGKGVFVLIEADPFMNESHYRKILSGFLSMAKGRNALLLANGNPIHIKDGLLPATDSPQIILALGIQSTNKECLKIVTRGFDKGKTEAVLRKIDEQSPKSLKILHFMLGLPGDTPEGFRQSLNWGLSWRMPEVSVFRTNLLPGSGMWDIRGDYGLQHEPKSLNEIYETATFPRKEMDQAFRVGTYINLFRTLPMVKRILGELGGILEGRMEHSYLAVYEQFLEYTMRPGSPVAERLSLDHAMDWSRRGVYWGNEATLEHDLRIALLKELSEYARLLLIRHQSEAHWPSIEESIKIERKRYEWNHRRPDWVRSILSGWKGPEEGSSVSRPVFLGADIYPVIDQLGDEGLGIEGIDTTDRPYYATRALILSRHWDKVRVVCAADLPTLRSEGLRDLILVDLTGRDYGEKAWMDGIKAYIDANLVAQGTVVFIRDSNVTGQRSGIEDRLSESGYIDVKNDRFRGDSAGDGPAPVMRILQKS